MTIALSLDPSSTCLGYAVAKLNGPEVTFAHAGRVKPKTKLRRERITEIGNGVWNLLDEVKPDHVIIEVPDGKVGYGHAGGGSGLSVYGQAVGFVCAVAYLHPGKFEIFWIEVKHWARGSKKEKRPGRALLLYQGYRAFVAARSDGGGDVADAICLLDWWADRRRVADIQRPL